MLVFKVLWNDLKRFELFREASAMAYMTLISFVPSLAVSFGLLSLFSSITGSGGDISHLIRQSLLSQLTEASGSEVMPFIDSFFLFFPKDVCRIHHE